MAVDDARRRRQQSRDTANLGLERAQGVAVEPLEVLDAVRASRHLQQLELGSLLVRDRYDHFADALVRDALFRAVAVERVAPANAEPRLEAAARVVDARMNDLGVA